MSPFFHEIGRNWSFASDFEAEIEDLSEIGGQISDQDLIYEVRQAAVPMEAAAGE